MPSYQEQIMKFNKKSIPGITYFSVIVLSLFCCSTGFSQTNEAVVEIFPKNSPVTTELKFPGERPAIHKIITDSARYPQPAIKDRIGGLVTVDFKIDTFGMVTPKKIHKGIRPDLDNEALRLVKLLNGWTAPSKNGKKSEVFFRMSFLFFPDQAFEKEYRKINAFNSTDFVIYGAK